MVAQLQNAKPANRRNVSGSKTIKSTTGSFERASPRDRSGLCEPKLMKKHQTHMSDEIECKTLSGFRWLTGHVYVPETRAEGELSGYRGNTSRKSTVWS